jgi:hypothetical protein
VRARLAVASGLEDRNYIRGREFTSDLLQRGTSPNYFAELRRITFKFMGQQMRDRLRSSPLIANRDIKGLFLASEIFVGMLPGFALAVVLAWLVHIQ